MDKNNPLASREGYYTIYEGNYTIHEVDYTKYIIPLLASVTRARSSSLLENYVPASCQETYPLIVEELQPSPPVNAL